MQLQGKRSVVTGSGRGIGRAIAVRFAREGADVVINDLDIQGPARETVAQVEAAGRRGVPIQADISQADQARRLIDDAVRQLGPLDILVNNAGIEKRAPFVEVTEADYDKVLQVNLKGAFFVTQAFVRHLLDDKRPGRIINISSVHEDWPMPENTPYCLSKGGMRMLTRTAGIERPDAHTWPGPHAPPADRGPPTDAPTPGDQADDRDHGAALTEVRG